MRQQLMGQLTPRQSQVAASAATANIDNDQTDDTISMGSQRSQNTTGKKRINYAYQFLFIIHMKNDSNQSNETCMKSMIMFSKIYLQWI